MKVKTRKNRDSRTFPVQETHVLVYPGGCFFDGVPKKQQKVRLCKPLRKDPDKVEPGNKELCYRDSVKNKGVYED